MMKIWFKRGITMKNKLSKKEIKIVAEYFYYVESASSNIFENYSIMDIFQYIDNLQNDGYNLLLDKKYLDYSWYELPSGKIVNIDDIYCFRRDELIEMIKEL